MPINPLKEFFKRKKAEIKFARAGPGQTLSDQSGPSSSSSSSNNDQSARRAAAEAAMKRYNKDQTKPSQRPRLAPQEGSASNQQQQSVTIKETASQSAERSNIKVAQKELPIIDGVAQRNVQIYSTEELAQRIKQPEIDDDFFKLTIEDAKLMQQKYTEERARNEILRTSEMRRREAETKKPTTNIARLRFRLPNDKVIEASFSGSETLALVRDWLVAACLERFQLELKNFDVLIGVRPVKPGDMSKSLRQLGLLPATSLSIIMKS